MPIRPIITLSNLSVRLSGQLILHNCTWEIKVGDQWAILGPNGSGKSTLVKALWGGVPTSSGTIRYHFLKEKNPSYDLVKELIGYVSFELHQHLSDHLSVQDEWQAFSRKELEKTHVVDIISWERKYREKAVENTALTLGISHLLDRDASALSSGEMRKTLIARALVKDPKLLILDEPFDGLDENSRADLKASIAHLIKKGIHIILVTHRYDEILPSITHVLVLNDGRISTQGKRTNLPVHAIIEKVYGKIPGRWPNGPLPGGGISKRLRYLGGSRKDSSEVEKSYRTLIEMKNVTVKYGNVTALSHITWTMCKGENWAILGPNGSGKSTLLELILGDNPQGYSNDIKLFGMKKGTGDTLWEIRSRIGVVSPKLQLSYRKHMSVFDVIASGFYNSIGLYHHPTDEERIKVDKIIDELELEALKDKVYTSLSYGQKRMVLLARALVKEPELLILDEPCHGLDMVNRKKILEVIQKVGESGKTNILYVTHQKDEILPCIKHILTLNRGQVERASKNIQL